MIDLKELKELLDKATPGAWEADYVRDGVKRIWARLRPGMSSDSVSGDIDSEDAEAICALHNNAKELLRLASHWQAVEQLIKEGVTKFNVIPGEDALQGEK